MPNTPPDLRPVRKTTLHAALSEARGDPDAGPIALILAEDDGALAETVQHHLRLGFARVWVLGRIAAHAGAADLDRVRAIDTDIATPQAAAAAVTAVARGLRGQWLYWGYNAEFLFYPFCETRSVADMTAFQIEERRRAVPAMIVDLYPGDPGAARDGIALTDAWLDTAGYYAAPRPDPANRGYPRERQLDLMGGLGWRFGDALPPALLRCDRIALFEARRGPALAADGTLSVAEMNTYEGPWHHTLSAAVVSFRRARALWRAAGDGAPPDFRWQHSARFDWQARQLTDLGMMEPGQWF